MLWSACKGLVSQHPLVSDQINQAINAVALDQQLTNQSHRWSFSAAFIKSTDRAVSRQVQRMSSFDCILRCLKFGIRYSSCLAMSAKIYLCERAAEEILQKVVDSLLVRPCCHISRCSCWETGCCRQLLLACSSSGAGVISYLIASTMLLGLLRHSQPSASGNVLTAQKHPCPCGCLSCCTAYLAKRGLHGVLLDRTVIDMHGCMGSSF